VPGAHRSQPGVATLPRTGPIRHRVCGPGHHPRGGGRHNSLRRVCGRRVSGVCRDAPLSSCCIRCPLPGFARHPSLRIFAHSLSEFFPNPVPRIHRYHKYNPHFPRPRYLSTLRQEIDEGSCHATTEDQAARRGSRT
jgi:hypothetical protein